jgi:hypothetical protein
MRENWIRDSKDPSNGMLQFRRTAFAAFVDGLKQDTRVTDLSPAERLKASLD